MALEAKAKADAAALDAERKKFAELQAQVKSRPAREHECRGQKENDRRKRQSEDPRQQCMHADETQHVVQKNIQLHGDGDGHHQGEQKDGCQQRNLGILPKHVTATVPGIPERQLPILVNAFQNGCMLEEERIPIGYSEAGTAG